MLVRIVARRRSGSGDLDFVQLLGRALHLLEGMTLQKHGG